MLTKIDSFIDLGDLGQPACEVTADVSDDEFVARLYQVSDLSVKVPALGNLDVTKLLDPDTRKVFEQELIDTYLIAKNAANVGRGVESYYAGRAARLSSLLGVA